MKNILHHCFTGKNGFHALMKRIKTFKMRNRTTVEIGNMVRLLLVLTSFLLLYLLAFCWVGLVSSTAQLNRKGIANFIYFL
jgi:hypothetical protein